MADLEAPQTTQDQGMLGGLDPKILTLLMLAGSNPYLKSLSPVLLEAAKQNANRAQQQRVVQGLQRASQLQAQGDYAGAQAAIGDISGLAPNLANTFMTNLSKQQEQSEFGKAVQAYDPSLPQNVQNLGRFVKPEEFLKMILPQQFQQGGVVQAVPRFQGQATPAPVMIPQRLDLPSAEQQARFPQLLPAYNAYNNAIAQGDIATAQRLLPQIQGVEQLGAQITQGREVGMAQQKSNIEEQRQTRMLGREEASAVSRAGQIGEIRSAQELDTAAKMNEVLAQRAELEAKARFLAQPLEQGEKNKLFALREFKSALKTVEANFDPALVGKGFSKLGPQYTSLVDKFADQAREKKYADGALWSEFRQFLGKDATPQEVIFWRALANAHDMLLRARSGAQTGEVEFGRIVGELPQKWDEPNVFYPALQRSLYQVDRALGDIGKFSLTPVGKLSTEIFQDVGPGFKMPESYGVLEPTAAPKSGAISLQDAMQGPPGGGK